LPPVDEAIPYRCVRCHALLTRVPPPDFLAALADRHSYTCGVCGHMMPACEVEAGHLDVKEAVAPIDRVAGSPPHDFEELLGFLQGQHRPGYLYRGQTRRWPGPLLPSLYRGTTDPEPRLDLPGHYRLRDLGKVFHAVDPGAARTQHPDLVKRSQFNTYLFQMFGYPFGSILAQQCGVTSEALDVSHHLHVAAFFAIFDPAEGGFPSEGTGVVYRIAVPDELPGNRNYTTANFFDCVPVISALRTFFQLRRCSSWDQAAQSFSDYFNHMAHRDQEAPRPLHLLGLPESDLLTCRVVQQQAALLLPDMVLPQEWKLTAKQPPPGKAEWNGHLLVEDLASREGVECFEFRHAPRDKYLLPRSPQAIFPAGDGVAKLLRLFLAVNPQGLFMTELGIQGTPDSGLIE
jgi:FRG domain